MKSNNSAFIFSAVILAAGIVLGGLFLADGLVKSRKTERYVTVRGLAEQEVKADLAFWPIRFVATGNELEETQKKIEKDALIVREFLVSKGIKEDEISVNRFDVADLMAQQYRSGPIESRFIVSQTLMTRTHSVETVAAATQHIGELVNKGVVLSSEMMPGSGGAFYTFNRLNDYKPSMIAEATRNAREGAEQFAADSGSKVGAIRWANQGVFQILGRDKTPDYEQNRQIDKIIRVVSTIDFYLED